ncbi:hypothetical protein TUM4433_39430 [Shewanella schlegeliana]|nr:hypothetical protein TUM4433_39430 [Shewanella schlegeliana]
MDDRKYGQHRLWAEWSFDFGLMKCSVACKKQTMAKNKKSVQVYAFYLLMFTITAIA